MLVQNFKTPADLAIADVEFEALCKVLGMLERKEIEDENFSMRSYTHPCGTPSCICGWAQHVSNNAAFPETARGSRFSVSILERPGPLKELFGVGEGRLIVRIRNSSTAPQAAIALRNYLTHGEPRWEEALAA